MTLLENKYLNQKVQSPKDDINTGNIFIPEQEVQKWRDKCGCTKGEILEQLVKLQKISVGTIPTGEISTIDLADTEDYPILFFRGNIGLLKEKSVAVVGTRSPTSNGIKRTQKVTELLVDMGFVTMSGLAKGIDAIAHKTALDKGGRTIAVLGTPINEVYPASNKILAEEIIKKNLILSPAMPYEHTGQYLFPRRNRLMAQLAVATIVIEVGSTSGVVHQAAECLRKGKKLIFLKSTAQNSDSSWIGKFVKSGGVIVNNANELRGVLNG